MITVWLLVAVLQTGEIPLAAFINPGDCYAAARNAVNDREVCMGLPFLGSDTAQRTSQVPQPPAPEAKPAPTAGRVIGAAPAPTPKAAPKK